MSFHASVLEDDTFDDEQPKELKEPIPLLADGWGSFGDYQLVGNGEVTNSYCGKYASMRGCLRVDLHNKTSLDGMNYAGKVFVRRIR